MKKLNKKGMTLVELIAAFVMVTVAATYFYKTLDVVIDLYKDSSDKTNEFVEKDYVIRIAEAYITTEQHGNCSTTTSLDNYAKGYVISSCGDGYPKTYTISGKGYNIYKVTLTDNTSDCLYNRKCRDVITFLYTK